MRSISSELVKFMLASRLPRSPCTSCVTLSQRVYVTVLLQVINHLGVATHSKTKLFLKVHKTGPSHTRQRQTSSRNLSGRCIYSCLQGFGCKNLSLSLEKLQPPQSDSISPLVEPTGFFALSLHLCSLVHVCMSRPAHTHRRTYMCQSVSPG